MFRKRHEEVVYRGFRTVLKRQFQLPSGRIHDYDIVHGGPVVCALVMDIHGKIVVTRQFRPGPERSVYVLPGGIIDPGETPAEAAARECFEETGYRGEVHPLASTWAGAYSTTLRHHFLIQNAVRHDTTSIDPDEIQEVIAVDREMLMEKVWSGEVMEVETLLLGLRHLKR
jgi:ADP-ribose pyrophosphatase